MSTDDAVDLNASIRPRELPESVKALREQAADVDRREWAVVRPRIATHLTAYKLVVGHLEAVHTHVIETTDLDPAAYSRPAAMWVTAGRCLGLARLAIVAVEADVCGEVLVVLRALQEARDLLHALGDPDEDDLLQLWLDDDGKYTYVSHAKSLKAQQRFESKLAQAMLRKGLGELNGSVIEASAEMYDRLSRAGHNRRSAALDAWWPQGRRMAYGPHWSAIRTATYVRHIGAHITNLVDIVGDALRTMLPPGVWDEQRQPLRLSIEAMDALAPLDLDSIRRGAAEL